MVHATCLSEFGVECPTPGCDSPGFVWVADSKTRSRSKTSRRLFFVGCMLLAVIAPMVIALVPRRRASPYSDGGEDVVARVTSLIADGHLSPAQLQRLLERLEAELHESTGADSSSRPERSTDEDDTVGSANSRRALVIKEVVSDVPRARTREILSVLLLRGGRPAIPVLKAALLSDLIDEVCFQCGAGRSSWQVDTCVARVQVGTERPTLRFCSRGHRLTYFKNLGSRR